MSTRRLPPDASGGDWQVLLESNYHHLCRSIRPEAFFSWLRSKGVFTSEDQEEIENKYVTTVMKSGGYTIALFHCFHWLHCLHHIALFHVCQLVMPSIPPCWVDISVLRYIVIIDIRVKNIGCRWSFYDRIIKTRAHRSLTVVMKSGSFFALIHNWQLSTLFFIVD